VYIYIYIYSFIFYEDDYYNICCAFFEDILWHNFSEFYVGTASSVTLTSQINTVVKLEVLMSGN
jgi:hypothetical protein